VKGNQGTIIAN
jgi:ribonuclease HI